MSGIAVTNIRHSVLLFGKFYYLQNFNIDQSIFSFFLGGGGDGPRSNRILEFNMGDEEWQEIGTMKEARSGHAVSIVGFEDFAAWCT